MTRGQFITVLTLGAALATGAIGLVFSAGLWFSPKLYFVVSLLAFGGMAVEQGTLAAGVAIASVMAALGVVKVQQQFVDWSARRQIKKLGDLYRDLEMALGTEKANAVMMQRVQQLQEQETVDLFGRKEVDTALRQAGLPPLR